ncbi:hypothetical protein SteCoe_24581 [Stentor coeruleus]|uniref:Rab-GAP TBC domain-containing protein n=1 Tax=Stentor coeruleus TaxID=5963 RepID=A0A1R2BHJ0_9CILI|nr:hypothetical protein SteCoe_24581 [Stentor coeruleus]
MNSDDKILKTRQDPNKTSQEKKLPTWKYRHQLENKEMTFNKQEKFKEKNEDLMKNGSLDVSALGTMINKYGEYPEKYRVQIWRTILKVPGNMTYFEELVKKGIHPAMESIKLQFPLKDQKLAKNFAVVVSALAYWAPILADAEFIPAIIFPFIKLSGEDLHLAFELSMSFIYNWLYTWFENFPNPPIKYLITIEDIIKTEEPKLYQHLTNLNLTCSSYIWPILKYLFTQVMTKEEFCILADHLITRFTSPHFLISISAAYILYYQSTLRSIKNTKDLQGFFIQQNPLNVKKLLKLAISLLPKTPELECRLPLLPEYPVFTNYPDFALSLQVAVREKLIKQDQELQMKRKYIEDISKKFEKMRLDEARERREQETLLQAEAEKRKISILEEKIRLEEKQKIDLETRRLRLAEIQKLEDTIEKSLSSQESFRKKELHSLEEEINMRTRCDNYYAAAKQEDENLSMLEFKAAQRLLELMRVRNAEESMRKLKLHAQHWEREQEQRERILKSAWEVENEQRRIDLELARESKLKELELCKEYNNKRRMDVQQHLKTLERELRTMDLEKERQLRLIAEEELLRNEEYLTQLKLKQELIREQEERNFQMLLNQEKEYKAKKNQELLDEIHLEQQKQAFQLQKQREENERLEREMEKKAVNDKIFQMRQESDLIAQEKEKMIQETLRKIEMEKSAQRRLQEDLEYKKKEINERTAYQKVVRDSVDEAIQRERENFMRFKDEIQRENDRVEYERKQMHERKMHEIARQREEALNQITMPGPDVHSGFIEKIREARSEDEISNSGNYREEYEGKDIEGKTRKGYYPENRERGFVKREGWNFDRETEGRVIKEPVFKEDYGEKSRGFRRDEAGGDRLGEFREGELRKTEQIEVERKDRKPFDQFLNKESEQKPYDQFAAKNTEKKPFEQFLAKDSEKKPFEQFSSKDSKMKPSEKFLFKDSEKKTFNNFSPKDSEMKPSENFLFKDSEKKPFDNFSPEDSEKKPSENFLFKNSEKKPFGNFSPKDSEMKPSENFLFKDPEKKTFGNFSPKDSEKNPNYNFLSKDSERKPFDVFLSKDSEKKSFENFSSKDSERKPFDQFLGKESEKKPFGQFLSKESERKPFDQFLAKESEKKPFDQLLPKETEKKPFNQFLQKETEKKPFDQFLSKESEKKPFDQFLSKESEKKPFDQFVSKESDRKPSDQLFSKDSDKKPFSQEYYLSRESEKQITSHYQYQSKDSEKPPSRLQSPQEPDLKLQFKIKDLEKKSSSQEFQPSYNFSNKANSGQPMNYEYFSTPKENMFDMKKISAFTKDIKENSPDIESSSNQDYDEESSSCQECKYSDQRPNLLSRPWEESSKSSHNSIESSELRYGHNSSLGDERYYISKTQKADIDFSQEFEKPYESHSSCSYSQEHSSCMYSSSGEYCEECSCDCTSKSSSPPLGSPGHNYTSSEYSEDSYLRHSTHL